MGVFSTGAGIALLQETSTKIAMNITRKTGLFLIEFAIILLWQVKS